MKHIQYYHFKTKYDHIQQRQNNQKINYNKKHISLFIGQSIYQIYVPQINTKQNNQQLINSILNCTQQQFNYAFKKYFPFFMHDFIHLYKRISKNFARHNFIRKQQFLKQKYQFSIGYHILLKWILRNTDRFTLHDFKYQGYKIKKLLDDQNISMIFRNMTTCTSWNLIVELVQKNTLKYISDVNFKVLKLMNINNSPIKSLQPLAWIYAPNLQTLQIGLLCTPTIKPMAHCLFDRLKVVNIRFIFQFHENRLYQTKKSIDISSLWRTKVYTGLQSKNQLCSSPLCLWDLRNTIKLQWKTFSCPQPKYKDQKKSFFTYIPKLSHLKVLKRRVNRNAKQKETKILGDNKIQNTKMIPENEIMRHRVVIQDENAQQVRQEDYFEQIYEDEQILEDNEQIRCDRNQMWMIQQEQQSKMIEFDDNKDENSQIDQQQKQQVQSVQDEYNNVEKEKWNIFGQWQETQQLNNNVIQANRQQIDNLFVYDDRQLYLDSDNEDVQRNDGGVYRLPQILRIVQYGKRVNFNEQIDYSDMIDEQSQQNKQQKIKQQIIQKQIIEKQDYQ